MQALCAGPQIASRQQETPCPKGTPGTILSVGRGSLDSWLRRGLADVVGPLLSNPASAQSERFKCILARLKHSARLQVEAANLCVELDAALAAEAVLATTVGERGVLQLHHAFRLE